MAKAAFFLGLMILLGVCLITKATWSDTTNTDDLTELMDFMTERWIATVALRDAALIVSKYTDDSIYSRSGWGVAHGPAEALQLYQDWFDSGVYRVDVEKIDIGTMGPDYLFVLIKHTCYDNADNVVEWGRNLVILRAEDGGFKTYLNMETLEYHR